MGPLKTIAFFVLVISTITSIALFGHIPGLRNTPIGYLHRLFWLTIPRFCRNLDNRVTGGRFGTSLSRLGNYLLYEKHPLVLGFFLFLLTGCFFLWTPAAWSRLTAFQRFLIPCMTSLVYINFYLAVFTNPGKITPENHKLAVQVYPYDSILFHPGVICTTCNLEKPARSKHCRICKSCIARHDHHCVWINNCVGQGNNHYFILFLLSITLLLVYGAYVSYFLVVPFVRLRQEALLLDHASSTAKLRWIEWLDSWSWALVEEVWVGGIGLLCGLCSPMGGAFLGYHIYLIWAGMTTNESLKWADWRDDVADGLVYMAESTPQQTVTRTANGEPPNYVMDGGKAVVLDRRDDDLAPHWRRVKSLRDVDNIYDRGFLRNFEDVFKPVL